MASVMLSVRFTSQFSMLNCNFGCSFQQCLPDPGPAWFRCLPVLTRLLQLRMIAVNEPSAETRCAQAGEHLKHAGPCALRRRAGESLAYWILCCVVAAFKDLANQSVFAGLPLWWWSSELKLANIRLISMEPLCFPFRLPRPCGREDFTSSECCSKTTTRPLRPNVSSSLLPSLYIINVMLTSTLNHLFKRKQEELRK